MSVLRDLAAKARLSPAGLEDRAALRQVLWNESERSGDEWADGP
jgi:hypothetical protein